MKISYYEILGVDRSASRTAIKDAYREIAKKYPPPSDDDGSAELRFKLAKEAHAVLLDRSRRAEYDLTLDEPKESYVPLMRESNAQSITPEAEDLSCFYEVPDAKKIKTCNRRFLKIVLLAPYWILKIILKLFSFPILIFMMITMPIFVVSGPIFGGIFTTFIATPIFLMTVYMFFMFIITGNPNADPFTIRREGFTGRAEGTPLNQLGSEATERVIVTESFAEFAEQNVFGEFGVMFWQAAFDGLYWVGNTLTVEVFGLILITITCICTSAIAGFLLFGREVWITGTKALASYVFTNVTAKYNRT